MTDAVKLTCLSFGQVNPILLIKMMQLQNARFSAPDVTVALRLGELCRSMTQQHVQMICR